MALPVRLVKAESKDGGMRTNDPTDTDIICPGPKSGPKCGRIMQIRTASTGVFSWLFRLYP